ncbi:unnamed protein product [Caenorhabditis auriculariae]|uniref:Uncharacterized protein n=1 Tax=Caenorhabditis auriculariae TaxID=2777116 RepID=A0A8S1GW17_9PELO|nr:unnamed protein product [Caenorhabditis auriculariae]
MGYSAAFGNKCHHLERISGVGGVSRTKARCIQRQRAVFGNVKSFGAFTVTETGTSEQGTPANQVQKPVQGVKASRRTEGAMVRDVTLASAPIETRSRKNRPPRALDFHGMRRDREKKRTDTMHQYKCFWSTHVIRQLVGNFMTHYSKNHSFGPAA